jgi:RHS repeat-associated protein
VLDTKTNKLAITVISAYDCAVNAIGLRTGVTTSGTAFPALPAWIWGYDSLGQVTSADSSIDTSDRAYQFDATGNRKKSADSLTLPSSDNYTTNALNQYTSRSVGVSPTLQKTRLWGMDLSGSMQGAGGVGGLLSESHISNPQSPIYYPTYDGNGNVSEYLNSAGAVIAHFEYDPFGNTVVNTDTNSQFAYRFSTKPLEFATGLYYYTYRHYEPLTGRWPSRDPKNEVGGPRWFKKFAEIDQSIAEIKKRLAVAAASLVRLQDGDLKEALRYNIKKAAEDLEVAEPLLRGHTSENDDFLDYVFLGNSPLGAVDHLGLYSSTCYIPCCKSTSPSFAVGTKPCRCEVVRLFSIGGRPFEFPYWIYFSSCGFCT